MLGSPHDKINVSSNLCHGPFSGKQERKIRCKTKQWQDNDYPPNEGQLRVHGPNSGQDCTLLYSDSLSVLK